MMNELKILLDAAAAWHEARREYNHWLHDCQDFGFEGVQKSLQTTYALIAAINVIHNLEYQPTLLFFEAIDQENVRPLITQFRKWDAVLEKAGAYDGCQIELNAEIQRVEEKMLELIAIHLGLDPEEETARAAGLVSL